MRTQKTVVKPTLEQLVTSAHEVGMKVTFSLVPYKQWACACVKRGRDGKLKSIKVHPETQKYCRVCHAKKPEPSKL
jgi:hypothetical protein